MLSRQRAAVVACALICVLPATAAHAKSHHHHHHGIAHHHHRSASQGSGDSRPAAWCGWQMRMELGVHDPRFNLARNWAQIGQSHAGPCVGCIVVWPHHVGRIVGRTDAGTWVVHSGNDGHRVRTRPRPVGGAIAFRVL